MAYKALRKLYYGDEDTYKQIYRKRFEADSTIKLDFTVAGHPAFFTQCDEVLQMMFQILKEDKEVAVILQELPKSAAQQYSRKCLIDEIVISNRIEGIHSSRKEIGAALVELENRADARGKKKRFHGIVNTYHKLMTHDPVPMETCEDIRALYDELVLSEVSEENPKHIPDGKIFRKDISELYNQAGKVVHKGSYPEEKVIDDMKKALAFLHDDSIELLYRLCVFHYLLEYIHPFYDGNGRLGRFIVSYYLSEGLEGLVAYRLSETILGDISKYYEAFETCNDPRNLGDLTPFLLMMLGMILNSLKELKNTLRRKRIILERYEEKLLALPNAERKNMNILYSILLETAVFHETGIPVKVLAEAFRLTQTTVRSMLNLIPVELLRITKGENRENLYELDLSALDAMSLTE